MAGHAIAHDAATEPAGEFLGVWLRGRELEPKDAIAGLPMGACRFGWDLLRRVMFALLISPPRIKGNP
jgi:hypothetical protein